MKRIRILLVEDNRVLREGITAIINTQPDMKVVRATDGKNNTLQLAHELNPDILLKGLGVQHQDSVHTVRSVSKELPHMKVIGMGLVPTKLDIVEFVEAGAAGFVLKDAGIAEFLGTVRSVARGENVLPPTLADSLFSHIVDHALKRGMEQLGNAIRMTRREREIIALIADGLSNKDIAQRLNIAVYTVKSHVHNILEKLALRSRLQISAFVHREEHL